MKNSVLYTRMENEDGQEPTAVEFKRIVSVAHALGYELVPFEGWSDSDFGSPRRRQARENGQAIREIVNALPPYFVSIFQTNPREQRVMEENEALAIIHEVEPSTFDPDI